MASLSVTLKNRKYIGEYKYADTIVPNGIPAIINPDLFERVQERMLTNKKAPSRTKADEDYLLTTKLFCGGCGRLMAGECGTSGTNGVKYYYYKCGGAKCKLGCKRKAVKKHWIERVAVVTTVERVLQGAEINRIADAIAASQDKEDTTLPALREQLKECEKSIENMLNAIQMSILTASAKTRLKEPEAHQNKLKLSIMQAELQKPKYTKEQIVSCINRFKYGDEDDIDYQKQIIDTFINAICVFDDKLVFTYNFKDGTEAIPLKAVEDAFGSNLTQADLPNWVKAISLDLFSCVNRIAAPSPKVQKGYVPQIRRHTVRKTIKPADVHFEREWTGSRGADRRERKNPVGHLYFSWIAV